MTKDQIGKVATAIYLMNKPNPDILLNALKNLNEEEFFALKEYTRTGKLSV